MSKRGKKGVTIGSCNIIIALARNYLYQGLCNKIKEFLTSAYITLFLFVPRCRNKVWDKSFQALLFKLKFSALHWPTCHWRWWWRFPTCFWTLHSPRSGHQVCIGWDLSCWEFLPVKGGLTAKSIHKSRFSEAFCASAVAFPVPHFALRDIVVFWSLGGSSSAWRTEYHTDIWCPCFNSISYVK